MAHSCWAFALLGVAPIVAPLARAAEGGYVAGNFGVSAQITEGAALQAHIRVNPPKLGEWLQEFGDGKLWVEADEGGTARPLKLRSVEARALYPEYRGRFEIESGPSAQIRVFAPLGLNAETGFLPALIFETTLKSPTRWSGRVGYTLTVNESTRDVSGDTKRPATKPVRGSNLAGITRGASFIGIVNPQTSAATAGSESTGLTLSTRVQLEANQDLRVIFIVGAFDDSGYYAKRFPTAEALLTGMAQQVSSLDAELEEFVAALPRTGDRAVDDYIRWYSSAGILLTKGIRTGEVLTMGYVELNQRDSFWTSGIHLVFWRELERKMILESVAGQLANGRIPVTILPLIDRGDELDSAEYFILRVARYYRWYRDEDVLKRAWPAIKKAIGYLRSRDLENVGVPMQTSYWADWKDVFSVEGRKYAPHFALLWLASLKAASDLAIPAQDPKAAAEYEEMAKRAGVFINRPFEQGGMWNGKNYVDRWQDGRKPNYVLQDQLVGAYFNVIPKDRLASIYRQLQANETTHGVRETFPYAPYSSGFHTKSIDGGNYHNGGIWPWLNFVDTTGRYSNGYTADAERIIHKVGSTDLEAEGDYQPGEFLNGDTGRNSGKATQAWDAALFSAIYFGAFGVERVSDNQINIRVRVPRERDFMTHLLLPGVPGTLSSRAGRLTWRADSSPSRVNVKLVDERPAPK